MLLLLLLMMIPKSLHLPCTQIKAVKRRQFYYEGNQKDLVISTVGGSMESRYEGRIKF